MARRFWKWVGLVIVMLLVIWTAGRLQSASPTTLSLQESWRLAQTVGVYHYTTHVQQVTEPLPTLENVGLGRSENHFYLAGRTDLAAKTMTMRLWADGGHVTDPAGALEIEVTDGQTRGRLAGGEWLELDDISALLAPGGDNLGFLVAAEDVAPAGTETRAGLTYHRYTFALNGPRFAVYMRDQWQAQLARAGRLPQGLSIELADHYVQMSGQGELWVNAATGLPLRQIISLSFPPDQKEQNTFTLTTDFSQWGESPLLTAGRPLSSRLALADWFGLVAGLGQLGLVVLVPAGIIFLWFQFGSRRLYKPVALVLVFNFLLAPFVQAATAQTAAKQLQQLNEEIAEGQAAQEAAQAADEAQRQWLTTDFNPTSNPLAEIEPTFSQVSFRPGPALENNPILDTDGDKLSDAAEAIAATSPTNPDTDGDQLPDGLEVANQYSNPLKKDSDGDSLDDNIEFELALDPLSLDSDGDQISDPLEIRGFLFNGNRLYLDPLHPDSNADGLLDQVECPSLIDVSESNGQLTIARPISATATCPDTDGDDEADIFDSDNDDDGVPDRVDDAPGAVVAGGQRSANCQHEACLDGFQNGVFELGVNGYTAGKPLFVDFQLRPADITHLWYTMHVLDWPDGDNEGQVTTGNGQTFGSSGREGYGDLRLMPMLEIVLPYQNGNYPLPKLANHPPILPDSPPESWLDQAKLDAFNITVRKLDDTGRLSLFVPLIIVEDPVGGGPVAFSGRAYYQPSAPTWGAYHEVRLIWMVQVLNSQGDQQIIQTYQDDWYLTGLSVREDSGTQVAIAYEDPNFAKAQPTYDPATYYEQNLWRLLTVLNDAFISGRSNPAGQRDMTVQTIHDRWDKNSNASVPAEQLIGIDRNALFVNLHQLEHQGLIGTIPGLIKDVLEDTFTGEAAAGHFRAPMLVMAREETARTVALSGDGVQIGNSQALSLDNVQPITLASFQLATYHYSPAGGWEPYAAEPYWREILSQRTQTELRQSLEGLLNNAPSLSVEAGLQAVAFSTFFSFQIGLNNPVQIGNTPLFPADLSKSDTELIADVAESSVLKGNLAKAAFGIFSAVGRIVIFKKTVSQDLQNAIDKIQVLDVEDLIYYGDTAEDFASLNTFKRLIAENRIIENRLTDIGGNSGILSFTTQQLQKVVDPETIEFVQWADGEAYRTVYDLPKTGFSKLKGSVAGAAVLGGLVGLSFLGDNISEKIAVVGSSIGLLTNYATTLQSTTQIVNGVQKFIGEGLTVSKALTETVTGLAKNLSKAAKISAAIGIVLDIGISVGFFLYQAISEGIDFSTRAGQLVLANLIAGLIVAVIMGVIAAIPGVGVLITAIIGAIDALISIICQALDADPNAFICGGITGALTKLVAAIIYTNQSVVNPQHEDHLESGQPSFQLGNEEMGYVVGNNLTTRLDISVYLFKNGVDSLGSALAGAVGFFGDDEARRASFVYELVTDPNHQNLPLMATQINSWVDSEQVSPGRSGDLFRDDSLTLSQSLTTSGANVPLNIYFYEAYHVPQVKCVTFVCDVDEDSDETGDVNDNITPLDIKFDVLPATFDEFLAMAVIDVNGGYSFAWGQNGTLHFPVFRDADGDGLASKAVGGNDPNDNAPDSDLDRLSDFYEVRNGLNPLVNDSDNDGLGDYDEVGFGTDPRHADSDNDGLGDGAEIAGWLYTFGPLDAPQQTLVRPDPLSPNPDGDIYPDRIEMAYGFHPLVVSNGQILDVTPHLFEEVTEPAGTICSTMTLTQIEITNANPTNDLTEFDDAEIELIVAGFRVLTWQNLQTGATIPLSFPIEACDTPLRVEIKELDQGWNDDLIWSADYQPDNTFSSGYLDGIGIRVYYSESPYTASTIETIRPTDGFIKPGDLLGYQIQVENELRNRNALGLVTADFPAGTDFLLAPEQPFILPPSQGATGSGFMLVDPALTASQVVTFTATVGALLDPDIAPPPVAVNDVGVPALWLTFDGDDPTQFSDSSPNQIPVYTTDAALAFRRPVAGGDGQLGESAFFEGDDLLGVFSPALDLHDATIFTLATWIYREGAMAGTIMGTSDAAAAGDAVDKKDAYPTLYVTSDNRLGLYMGDGTTYCEFTTTTTPVAQNQWQHVAATFDGNLLTFYVDGAIVDSSLVCSGLNVVSSTGFWIGRASRKWQLNVERIYVVDEGDSGGDAELELYGNLGQAGNNLLWHDYEVTDGEEFFINQGWVFDSDDFYHLVVCESDNEGTPGCNTDPNLYGDPDEANVWSYFNNSSTFTTPVHCPRPGYFPQNCWNESLVPGHDGQGELYFSTNVAEVAFLNQTHLDDLRLYKEALSQDDILSLISGSSVSLDLHFNEPPGANRFYDYSGNRHDAVCGSGHCPLSGVMGFSQQAARFDGDNDFAITYPAGTLNIDSGDFTLTALVKGEGAAADGVILSNDLDGDGRLELRLVNGILHLYVGNSDFTAGGSLAPEQWALLIFIYDATLNQAQLLLNYHPQPLQRFGPAGPSPFTLGGTDSLFIGGTPTGDGFQGLIDRLGVIPGMVSGPDLEAFYRDLPLLRLPFDEPANATTFTNIGLSDNSATCPAGQCPKSGSDGQHFASLTFDGLNDRLTMSDDGYFSDAFSVSLWVKPTKIGALDQPLFLKEFQSGDPNIAGLSLWGQNSGNAGKIEFWACTNLAGATSQGQILLEAWNHLVLVHFENYTFLYINGALDSVVNSPSNCTETTVGDIYIGGLDLSGTTYALHGDLDEIVVSGPLLPNDVAALYAYQVAWYDATERLPVVVDAVPPTATFGVTTPLRGQAIILPIQASDVEAANKPSAGVSSVEYSLWYGGSELTPYAPATRDGQVWLFKLNPTAGDGAYMLWVRVTDRAGNVTVSAAFPSILVDNTSPFLTLNRAWAPGRSATNPLFVTLEGTVNDANGVNDVRVDLQDVDGLSLSGQQLAMVSGNGWTVDYPLAVAPYGTYSVTLRATDTAGNVISQTESIELDQTAPVADLFYLDGQEKFLAGTGVNLPLLVGTASDIPVLPLAVAAHHFVALSGDRYWDGTPNRNHALCSLAACPTAVPGRYDDGVVFDGLNDSLSLVTATDWDNSSLDIQGQITLAVWVKPTVTNGEQIIVASGPDPNNMTFLRVRDGFYEVGVVVAGTTYQTTVAIPAGDLGNWVHLAGLYNGGEWLLYRNGQLAGRTPASVGAVTNGQQWTIGAVGLTPSRFLAASLDELYIYNRQLPLSTIRALAQPVATAAVATLEVGFLPLQAHTDLSQISWLPATFLDPLAAVRRWSLVVPAGLEGPYRLYLRASDSDGQLSDTSHFVWQGEIDTLAPRLTLSQTPFTGGYFAYGCSLEDYNLNPAGISCPTPLQITNQSATWFTDLYGPSVSKAFQANSNGTIIAPAPQSLTACDLYGNCASEMGGMNSPLRSPEGQVVKLPYNLINSDDLAVPIIAPLPQSGFSNPAGTIPISGLAAATNEVAQLAVAVNGDVIYTTAWAAGITQTTWTTNWVPGASGLFTITAVLTDSLGNSTTNTTTNLPLTIADTVVYVGNQPPTVTLTTSQIGPTAFLPTGQIALQGQVSDSLGIATVEARLVGAAWQRMTFSNGQWAGGVAYDPVDLPDGATLTVEVRATNLVGLQTTLSDTLLADIRPPEPFVAGLSYEVGGGTFVPIGGNETVTEVSNPTLRLSWTASSDGSGLSLYTVRWYNLEADGTYNLLAQQTTAGLIATFAGNEGQHLYATVEVSDSLGNSQLAPAGPIYLDDHLTPAYLAMSQADQNGQPYRNWLEDSCNQLGLDNRYANVASSLSALNTPQAFFATWDAAGLRLAWTGANVERDGDLFIYLDTVAGAGSSRAFDPYGSGDTIILLPIDDNGNEFTADYLLWLAGENNVQLRQWDGSNWVVSAQPFDFVLEDQLPTPHNDLFVPFSSIAIGDPANNPLSLVAFASADDNLRLWATMPNSNPLNSPDLVAGAAGQPLHLFALTQRYHWAGLGDGVCPSAGQNSGPNLGVSLATSRQTIHYQLLGDGLFYAMPDLLAGLTDWAAARSELCLVQPEAALCERELIGNGPPAGLDFDARHQLGRQIDLAHELLGDGESVSLTLTLLNQGLTTTAPLSVTMNLSGPLQPIVANVVVPPFPAGTTLSITLALEINTALAPGLAWGSADIVIYDKPGNPLEWLFVAIEVDQSGPSYIELNPLLRQINPAGNNFSGVVVDQSAITNLDFLFNGQPLACLNESDLPAEWACQLDLAPLGLSDGQTVAVQVRGTDEHGQVGPYSPAVLLVVDSLPPVVALSDGSQAYFADALIGRTENILTGVISDTRGQANVEICKVVDGAELCAFASPESNPNPANVYVTDEGGSLPIPACGSGGLVRTLTVAQSFVIGDLNVGLNLSHPFRNDILATLQSPAGTILSLVAAGSGASNYALLLDDGAAADLASDFNDQAVSQGFANPRRPVGLLADVRGEDGAGNWTLTLCDQYPTSDDGFYHQSQLIFTPRDPNPPPFSGQWLYDLNPSLNVEQPGRVLRLYGVDPAGNRSAPLEYTYTLDTKPPQLLFYSPIAGQVTDGVGVDFMLIKAHTPDGETLLDRVAINGNQWVYTDTAQLLGDSNFIVYVEAVDTAGNFTEAPLSEFVSSLNGLQMVNAQPVYLTIPAAFTSTVVVGIPLSYTFDFGDGLPPTIIGPNIADGGAVFGHVYDNLGGYTVTVTATNTIETLTALNPITVQDVPIGHPMVSTGFESQVPPVLWEVYGTAGWTMNNSSAYEGSQSAFHDDVPAGQDSWLVTHQLRPTAGTQLTFWQQSDSGSGMGHSLWVSAGSPDPADGDYLLLANMESGRQPAAWEQVSIPMGNYAGQAIYVAFRYEGNGAEWYVDNVYLGGGVIAANDSLTQLGNSTTLSVTIGSGTNVTYSWDFGDGNGGSGPMVSYVYPAAGIYTATVRAENSVSVVTATTIVQVASPTNILFRAAAATTAPAGLGVGFILLLLLLIGTLAYVVIAKKGQANKRPL